jgi:haloalkane dehalogenase
VELDGRRLIAPDLIGMGDSEKLPPEVSDRYRFASHAHYFEGFMDAILDSAAPVVLVLHDWGGAIGFDWASRHPDRVRGLAYTETFVRPLTWADLPESFHPTLKAVRSLEGERLVLDENMFIEKMLPGVTQRSLLEEEMTEYRRPYLEAGDSRRAMLQWPREVPVDGEPVDVMERMEAYSNWLKTSPVPKLFIDADPGVFITGDVRTFARSLPNQLTVTVPGLHFVQEDSASEVGFVIAEWLRREIGI